MAWAVSEKDKLVTVVLAGDRKEVYDILRRRFP